MKTGSSLQLVLVWWLNKFSSVFRPRPGCRPKQRVDSEGRCHCFGNKASRVQTGQTDMKSSRIVNRASWIVWISGSCPTLQMQSLNLPVLYWLYFTVPVTVALISVLWYDFRLIHYCTTSLKQGLQAAFCCSTTGAVCSEELSHLFLPRLCLGKLGKVGPWS